MPPAYARRRTSRAYGVTAGERPAADERDRDMADTGIDLAGEIIAYESGELDPVAMVELFSHLVRTSLAWKLQGHYGRTAASLIDGGILRPSGEIDWDAFDALTPADEVTYAEDEGEYYGS